MARHTYAARTVASGGTPVPRRCYSTAEELEAALDRHVNKKLQLGETLLELGFVDEETLLRFLGAQLQVPRCAIREGMVDPKAVRLIPRHKAEALCAIAMFKVRGTLSVAMVEPRNLQHIDEIERFKTGLTVRPVVALKSNNSSRTAALVTKNDFSVDAVTADFARIRWRFKPKPLISTCACRTRWPKAVRSSTGQLHDL